MSATATATTRPEWMNKPAWETTKQRIRRMAGEQGHEADALALHYFDTDLDALQQWQAMEIAYELKQAEDQKREQHERENGTPGTCFECGVKLATLSSQCGACKEGIGRRPAKYDHSQAERMAHLSKTTKRQRFINYN